MQTKDHRVTEHPGERIDDLQRCGCRIIQNRGLFCFGMDAVLLAAFAHPGIREGMHVLDLCSGNGIIPILLDARLGGADVHYTGVEVNPVCTDMARRSALMNGQQERVWFIEEDIKQVCTGEVQTCPDTVCGEDPHSGGRQDRERLAPASFDAVTVNPPYMTGGGGITGENYDRTIARFEVLCSLDDVMAASSRALRFGGHLYMVHRPHRLSDVFASAAAYDLGIKRIRMVHSYADREANMVLIEAVKGGKPYIRAESPLIIFDSNGERTEEVRDLYG